jgi:gliding motility-associated-like protein
MMGCLGVDTITVEVIDIDCISIPSSFTPNGDGVNDVWVIDNSQIYDGFEVNIFNRWGQSVFSSIGTYESWDGTYNGQDMPATTYYYFIRISADSPMMQGTVTIVR